ncbi:hypothetical protein BCR36DRAFT_404313 [Piromyces finnis]|uniref:NDT80 domain-containing protein n=1 Tax=Piromyces finnis TaxID=1754191 RepID=A0A1Y1VA17_9FUNG|nr:hypothetical protein BCR36DRAFT_404313 [Piromyces finnis]|eukprot:ORX50694.1 hypothetical protein BCR36DRAFT_404313 [Piromyces finnis]
MATVMDANIQPANPIYNIQQNDYGNNSFPQTTNQYQNQNYSYQAKDITYLPQNQAMINNQYPPQNQAVINNQYPPQNQQIIQQTQPPPPQYNNIPLKKLSIDTHTMTKTATLNSAPPQINTTGLNTGSPYYVPSPRRRRGDHTNYESSIRSFFGRTKQHCNVFDISHTKSYIVIIDPKVDRGFFIAENNWTCYRRNYFQISTVFSCIDVNTNEQVQLPCLVEANNKTLKVNAFSLGISSRISNSDKKIDIIQHTPKRDKGPQIIPKPKIIKAGGSHSQFASIGNEQSLVTFERLQFKTATANNGKRRAAQQYYVLVLDLIANTEDGEIRVATVESDHLVVRGRSPGHYNDITLNTSIPRTVTMTSSASAAEGRFSRYPLTPTYGQYNNSPMILSPHSPASPGMPFHPGSQTPIQTPHSMLRQPPLNYSSPQPMSGISSNPGTPTNAATPINLATAAMPINNVYAVKEDSNQYYAQNPHPSGNVSTLPNQNQNQSYDNSQSSSIYINQTPSTQPTNINNQQNFIPQTQAPIPAQGVTNPPTQPTQQSNYYQSQAPPPTQASTQIYDSSFYPISSQQGQSDPYAINNASTPTTSNSNANFTQQAPASYQGTPNPPPQSIYMTQPQATTLAQAPQTTQNQYISQSYSQPIAQTSQYTIQSTTQEYSQPAPPPQQSTPQQAYLTQPSTQAYLTPPQATAQQASPPPSNYINGIPNQTQSTFMDSPSIDKSSKITKNTVEYLNSPSSNKNEVIESTKGPEEVKQFIDSKTKDPKNWLNNSNPPSVASTQHNEISSLTSK